MEASDATKASDITSRPPPSCPTCGQPMTHYGGSAGYIHCDWKLLYRGGDWFDDDGQHVKDERLAGGAQRVDGEVTKR